MNTFSYIRNLPAGPYLWLVATTNLNFWTG